MKYFFMRIIDPAGKEKTNVYAYMFLCDFFNFLLLIFGFSAFGVSTWEKSFAKLLIIIFIIIYINDNINVIHSLILDSTR